MNSSLRAAVIAEWRGLPARKLQPDRWQSPSELMPKLMQRLGLRERLRETEVIYAWSKIVGDFIAAHSAPVALREGILYVRVLQPARRDQSLAVVGQRLAEAEGLGGLLGRLDEIVQRARPVLRLREMVGEHLGGLGQPGGGPLLAGAAPGGVALP